MLAFCSIGSPCVIWFIEFAHTPPVGSLPEGMGRDAAHCGRTPHGAARGERAWVYCPSLWLRSWWAFIWWACSRMCSSRKRILSAASRSTSFARGFRKIWRVFFDTHADAGPMCLFAHKPPPERFRQCCRKRFSAFSDTPHYPSRKNSVVNTPESKTPAKDLRSRVCNRHPRRPVKGVLLTPKAKKIGRQALVKSVCRW